MHRLLPIVLAFGLCAAASASAAPTNGTVMPGAPMAPGCMPALTLIEPPEGGPEFTLFQFPPECQVFAGTVVLIEDPTHDFLNPSNWSDVIVFYTPGAPPLNGSPATIVAMVSDPAETGITDADLAAAGVPVTVGFILAQPNSFYFNENQLEAHNYYTAIGPGGEILYDFQSDPAEPPTAADPTTWGHLKQIYR